jgi:hypothetical protein
MFEQLSNELGGLWTACITYPFSVTIGISATLNLALGWKYIVFKETYDWMEERFEATQKRSLYLYQEYGKLEAKLKKYEKVKKPLINNKHGIKSKLKEIKNI